MKIIEGMKRIKELTIKQEDLRDKISKHCSHLSHENPVYGTETPEQVKQWLQAHEDIGKEIIRLRMAIQKTNLATEFPVELGGKNVTKTIAEWLIRRGTPQNPGLANADREAWAKLSDRGLQGGTIKDSMGQLTPVTIVRNFDPTQRDEKINMYMHEPSQIDAALEVANAVTDLVEV